MRNNTTSFLFDWDEAADHLHKYEECPEQFDAHEKAINKKIIQYLQNQVRKADRSSERIHFSCGSMRQSISLEAYNFIQNATFCLINDTFFRSIKKHLISNLQSEIIFNKYLLSDSFEEREDGETYQCIQDTFATLTHLIPAQEYLSLHLEPWRTEEQTKSLEMLRNNISRNLKKNQRILQKSNYISDVSKCLLVMVHAIRLSREMTTSQGTLVFVDDNIKILNKVNHFFSSNPTFLPKTIILECHHVQREVEDECQQQKRIARIEGMGKTIGSLNEREACQLIQRHFPDKKKIDLSDQPEAILSIKEWILSKEISHTFSYKRKREAHDNDDCLHRLIPKPRKTNPFLLTDDSNSSAAQTHDVNCHGI